MRIESKPSHTGPVLQRFQVHDSRRISLQTTKALKIVPTISEESKIFCMNRKQNPDHFTPEPLGRGPSLAA